jgi:peptidoglycan/xylan/chitin deacetylase (PgdA/CDA1 family)
MRLPGLAKLQHVAGRIRKRWAAPALILMYHRVAEETLDPWDLCVTPQHFAEQMEALGQYACPAPLQDLSHALQAGEVPNRAITVTFDDGYADNLYHAKPILERFAIPATVFLVSGQIGSDQLFWWDELAQLLLRPAQLPTQLCLSIQGHTEQWELGTAAAYSQEERQRDRGLRPWESVSGSRYAFHYAIWQRLRPLPHPAQQQAMDQLRAWSEAEAGSCEAGRALGPAEVATLEHGGLIEIGAHTITHPSLSTQPEATQHTEIQQSKVAIEQMLGHPVTSFSYPFGDYNSETLALVRAAGFDVACTVEAARIWRSVNCLQLPRFEVLNWSGDEFIRRLEESLRG